MQIRNEAERVIKECGLDRGRLHEVSKYSYDNIIHRFTKTFVTSGDIHRCWDGRIKEFRSTPSTVGIDGEPWYHRLTDFIPSEIPVYLILEDYKGYEPKYWVYEAYPSEIVTLLDEVNGPGEYYIVSKKFDWLICGTHEDTVYCSGDIVIK